MTQKLFLFVFLSCMFCEGQSVLTTPTESTRSVPASSNTPSTGAASAPMRSPPQTGERTDSDGIPFSPVPAPIRAPYRIAGPLTTKSDFERFAEDGTGHRLPVYARRLFDEVPTTFAPVERVPVPADYVLGPGDELLIRAWGKIDLDSRVTVDRNGQVYLPRVGTLNVAGLRFEQVEGYLHAAVSALFKDFELNVALGQLRSIQIFVLGSARQPGAYTVGSLSTLVDALFASGGPSATGSMRHIQLRRGNRLLAEFDMYDLVQKGDKSHDVPLLPGDVIYIPPIGAQVAISGNVNEPGIYELKAETTVAAALDGASGLTSLAGAERVLLERIDNHSTRRVEEFPLDAAGFARLLHDGDVLRIYPLSPKFENAVTLRGNVAEPGRYVWKEGMRVSDLIPSRDFLVTRDFWNRENHVIPPGGKHQFGDPSPGAYAHQGNDPQFLPLSPQDPAASREEAARSADSPGQDRDSNHLNADNSDCEDTGGCRAGKENTAGTHRQENPDRQIEQSRNLDSQKTIGIVRNNTEINWHYASIERLDEHDLSPRLIAFELGNAIDNRASSDNQLLKAGDVITIFSRADIPLPIEEHATFVRVGGEVNAPGIYRVQPGDTLRDAVRQAGGLTAHSYLYASQLLRVSTRTIQEEQLKRSTEQMQRELSSNFANSSLPSANKDAEQTQLSMRQALIARISSITPTGRVVLEMTPDASTLADIPDFTLEDGDSFYIPPRFSTVQVSGAVYNENAFRYQKNKLTTAYLADAGGATRDADAKRMFLIRADGTVISRQSHRRRKQASFEKTALLPGDAIVIPVKLNTGAGWKQLEEITGILSQSAITAASLAVIQK
jgi:polysaccharide biosynthesis/export protein